MNKIFRLFIVMATTVLAFTSCNNKQKPDDSEMYSLVILINEGGPDSFMDMIGYNEDDLVLEGMSMGEANDAPLQGEFKGMLMDGAGYGYPLLANKDMYAKVDLTRFKIEENNLLTDLSNPKALTLAGYNLYILNEGSHPDSSANIVVYSTLYDYKKIAKIPVNKGGTDIYVDNTYMYVAGKEGIELYGHNSHELEQTVKTPTEPKRFFFNNNSSITVSCPGTGLCTFDLATFTILSTLEVPMNEAGDMGPGKDQNDILTFTDTEVYLSNLATNSTQKIYTGTGITGAARSINTKHTFVATEGGTKQLVFNDLREKVAEFSTPAGEYTYLFSKRVIYED